MKRKKTPKKHCGINLKKSNNTIKKNSLNLLSPMMTEKWTDIHVKEEITKGQLTHKNLRHTTQSPDNKRQGKK